MDLYDLYCTGETLIIEHTDFRREGERWIREERHSIVGHPPERWTLYCVGPGDHSDMQGPPPGDGSDCILCRQCLVHTKALHRANGPVERTLEL